MCQMPADEHTLRKMTLINTSFPAMVTVFSENFYSRLSVFLHSNVMFSDSTHKKLNHKLQIKVYNIEMLMLYVISNMHC